MGGDHKLLHLALLPSDPTLTCWYVTRGKGHMPRPSSSSTPASANDEAVDRAAALSAELAAVLPAAATQLASQRAKLVEATTSLETLQKALDTREADLAAREAALTAREAQVAAREAQCLSAKAESDRAQQALEQREKELKAAEKAAVAAAISHASAPPEPPKSFLKPMSERLEMQVLARATAIALVKHGIQSTKASRGERVPLPPPPAPL